MNSTPALAPKSWNLGRRATLSLILLGLVIYVAFIATHIGAVAGGSDSSGYLNQARALATGKTHLEPRELPTLPMPEAPPYLYSPLGMKPTDDQARLVLTYPIGLPLIFVLAQVLTGWDHVGNWVLALHMLAGVFIVYAWFRAIELSGAWSAVGGVIIGVSPLYLNMGLQAMSDVPALVWTTAAVLAAWHSRKHGSWACAAGGAFAVAVLIRPNNLLAIVPVAIALGLSLRRWLAFGLSGVPGAAVLALYNLATYGHPMKTGYGDPVGMFHAELIGTTLLHYARWLPALFTPIVLLALGLPWLGRREPRLAALLGAWILSYAGFYVSYYHTHEWWWYLRFLLPAVPALVGAGLVVVQRSTRAWKWRMPTPAGVGLTLLLVVLNAVAWSLHLNATNIGRGERVYPETAAWAEANLPRDAVIAAMQVSGALFYYTDFVVMRWDSFEAKDRPRVMDAINGSKRPLYAILFPFEETDALQQRMGGKWTKIGNVRHVGIWCHDGHTASP